jgi:DNA-binding transcriptional ArsR family regulator
MVEYSSVALDDVFAAVADPTRRAILKHLGRRPARVTDIASRFPVSLNAVSKHLKVLERAGLIERQIIGREHTCKLNAQPLAEASLWMIEMQAFWEVPLDALEEHIIQKRKGKR